VSEVKDGGPAFPAHDYIVGDLAKDKFAKLGETRGMLLRDYFAAKAMEGWLASYGDVPHPSTGANGDTNALAIALQSYAMADAMLKAREQK
jgi:hypothetical protein